MPLEQPVGPSKGLLALAVGGLMEKQRKELEKLLELASLDEAIRNTKIDTEPMPLERALELAKQGKAFTKAGKPDGRREAGKRRAKKNASRRKRNARQQRWRRNWRQRKLQEALDGNYYAYLRGRWKVKGRGWEITEEEWLQHIQPCIPKGVVVELRRYDTSQPARLDNVIVYNISSPEGEGLGDVLFDGKEYALRSMGAIL